MVKVNAGSKRPRATETRPRERLEERRENASAQPAQPSVGTSTPYIDVDEHSVEQYAEECPSEPQPHAHAHRAPRPQRSTASRNAAEHSNWEGAMPEFIWQYTAMQGSKARAGQHARVAEFLCSSVRAAVAEQLEQGCMFCAAAGECMQHCPKRKVTFVDIDGSVELEEPRYRCTHTHTHAHTHTHTCAHIYTHMSHACTRVHMRTHMHAHSCLGKHGMHADTNACAYTYMRTHAHMRTCTPFLHTFAHSALVFTQLKRADAKLASKSMWRIHCRWATSQPPPWSQWCTSANP